MGSVGGVSWNLRRPIRFFLPYRAVRATKFSIRKTFDSPLIYALLEMPKLLDGCQTIV